jgi:hypothetical protein
LLGDLEGLPQQGLRRRGAEADEHARLDQGDLRFEPRAAGADFRRVRLGVNPPLAARFPFEVLDDVRDVDDAAIDAGFLERAVEQLSGGTDEGMAREIFGISRLFLLRA